MVRQERALHKIPLLLTRAQVESLSPGVLGCKVSVNIQVRQSCAHPNIGMCYYSTRATVVMRRFRAQLRLVVGQ